MARNTFDDILDRCVSMLHAGVTIEDAVAAYPAQAPALRERLAVAQTLSAAIPRQQFDAAILARARSRFLAAVRERSQGEPAAAPASSVFGFATRGVRRLVLVPYALPAVAAMVILGGAAAGIAAGTGNSNPITWFDGSSGTQHVKLQGAIVAINPSAITITIGSGDVTVQITPQTEFKDGNDAPLTIADFAVGDFVKISAFPGVSGALVAHEVEREEAEPEDQPPAATATDNSNPGPGGPTDEHQGEDDADNETPGQGDAHDATPENDDSHGPGPEGTKEPEHEGEDGTPASGELGDDDEGASRGSAGPVSSSEGDGTEPAADRDDQTSDGSELDTGHEVEPSNGPELEKSGDSAELDTGQSQAPSDGSSLHTGHVQDHAGDIQAGGS